MMKNDWIAWTFTAWKKPVINMKHVQFLVWQKEFCPSTKLEHYQGYVEFTCHRKLFQVKSLFKDKTMHCEVALKCRLANYKYCTKARTSMNESYCYGNPLPAIITHSFDDFPGALVPTDEE